MASSNIPEIKSGFFGGATELAKYLIDQGAQRERDTMESLQKVVDIDGIKYIWNRNSNCWNPIKPVLLTPPDKPVPPTFHAYTLNGLIDYIKEDVEGVLPSKYEERLILHVVDYRTVRLLSHPSENQRERHVIAECVATLPSIQFGSYIDTERFITMLLSNFIDTEARESLFKVLKSMTKEQNCNTADDGVSQVVTVRQGITTAANVTFKNPVPLKPIRTFTEVEQPESNFTLRINEEACAALYEADGGAWKNEAVANIRDYLRDNLKGCYVCVIA